MMGKKYIQRCAEFISDMNKLWVTGGYTIFAIILTICFIYMPNIRATHSGIFTLASFIMVVVPILITISNIINIQTTMGSLKGLATLYLQIILIFGVIYYFGSATNTAKNFQNNNSKSDDRVTITGIDTNWIKLAIQNEGDKREVFYEALIGFQDCIHFSLITSTTVGYGDSVPISPMAKLLVDIQVLVSCFLIAFGVGSFFNSDKSQFDNRLATLENKIDELIKKQS